MSERLEQLHGRIAAAARRTGRDPAEVRLIAVCKGQTAAAAAALADCGQVDFGENRLQEALSKIPVLPAGLRWHFLGHLQRNKVQGLLAHFSMLHSLDSLELAREIDRRVGGGPPFPCLVEVNIGAEPQKSGLPEAELEGFLRQAAALPGLRLCGLMAVPPAAETAEAVRPYFRRLAELRRQGAPLAGPAFTELSMGMSADFEVAVEEGATMVRIGTALFGSR